MPKDLPRLAAWQGLARRSEKEGRESADVRSFIRSLPAGVAVLARAVRPHSGIENRGHGTRERIFRAEASRRRRAKIRENYAWLNRLA